MNKVWMLGLLFISIGQLNGMETGLNILPLEGLTDQDGAMFGLDMLNEEDASQILTALASFQEVEIPHDQQSSEQSLAVGPASTASDKKRKRTHTEERSYVCGICYQGFKQDRHLRSHALVHKDERPFVCEICHRGFKVSGDLKKHTVVHSDERPYKCEICDQGFKRSNDLKKHTVAHTDERPYKCEICDKSFRYSSNVSRHKKVHEK